MVDSRLQNLENEQYVWHQSGELAAPSENWLSQYPFPIRTKLESAASLLRHLFLDVYQLEGEFNGEKLRIIVADHGPILGLVRHVAMPGANIITRMGKISALSAHKLINNNADLVFAGVNRLLLKKYYYAGFDLVPRLVRVYMDVTGHPDEMISNLKTSTRKDILRSLRIAGEQNITCDLTHSPKWLDYFYNHIYRPYTINRHNEYARVQPYSRVKKAFNSGIGISLMKDGELIGGAVAVTQGPVFRNYYLGLLGNQDKTVRAGAFSTLYYYTMGLAHSWGYSKIDFGRTDPFITSGALSYKLRWGMRVVSEDPGNKICAIAAPGMTEKAVKYLNVCRYYQITPDGLALSKKRMENPSEPAGV